jgi:hypothetical protein
MFAAALGSFALSRSLQERGVMTAGSAALLVSATAFLAAFLVLGSLAWMRHPTRQRRLRLKAESVRLEEAQRQRDAELEKLRRQWREPCRAWDEFCYDAGILVSTIDDFRYEDEPKNWQTIMVIKAGAALTSAHALPPSHRQRAEQLIRPFETPRPAAAPSAQHLQTELYVLREWLREMSDYYRDKKHLAGMD